MLVVDKIILHNILKQINTSKNADEYNRRMIENNIIQTLKEHPHLITHQFKSIENNNIGMLCVDASLEQVILFTLDNMVASTQQNRNGCNIGMKCASHGLLKATLKALDNIKASIQQDKDGWNIGMHSAYSKMEEAVIKALDNPTASIQQNKIKNNIGMFSASFGLTQATNKALTNTTASNQQNLFGLTISDIVREKNKEKEMQVFEEEKDYEES